MQIGILEPNMFSLAAITKLKKIGNVTVFDGTNLKQFLFPLNILFIRLSYNIDKSFLNNCPKLKWLCSPTTGTNHLDYNFLKAKKINLITLKGEVKFLKGIRATPEHTFGLILAILRKYNFALSDIKNGKWDRNKCRGEEIKQNKIGIIGLGRVGYQLATYCHAFGAEVSWFDNAKVKFKPNWKKFNNVMDLIKHNKVIVLCADFKKGQLPIINKKEIKVLTDKYFINSSRGELVDEDSLINFVKNGNIAGVALDVITNENSKNNLHIWKKLSQTFNVFLTPHIGGMTKESLEKTELFIVKKLHVALIQENK